MLNGGVRKRRVGSGKLYQHKKEDFEPTIMAMGSHGVQLGDGMRQPISTPTALTTGSPGRIFLADTTGSPAELHQAREFEDPRDIAFRTTSPLARGLDGILRTSL